MQPPNQRRHQLDRFLPETFSVELWGNQRSAFRDPISSYFRRCNLRISLPETWLSRNTFTFPLSRHEWEKKLLLNSDEGWLQYLLRHSTPLWLSKEQFNFEKLFHGCEREASVRGREQRKTLMDIKKERVREREEVYRKSCVTTFWELGSLWRGTHWAEKQYSAQQ